jgi:glycosyltransferase involved in cell wall biosynthesis
MNEINVLYSFPLRLGTKGVGMVAWHQVTGLLEQGANVTLYAGSFEKEIHGLSGLKETLVPGGIRLPIKPLGTRRACSLHDRIVSRTIRRNQKNTRIDIIHCWPLGSLETLKLAKQLEIRSVLERPNSHTRYAYEVVRQECKKLGIKLSKSHSHNYNPKRLYREEREYELADLILCPSDFVAKTFRDKGFKESRIARHQYGFDPETYTLPSNDTRENDKSFKVAFAGSCGPRKGLHYALEAWLASEASKNGTFYICGAYVPGYRELLADKLAHPSIKEMGYLDDISSLLCQCHALILPSIEEGSALITYEARACGCVLLVSEASGAHCTHMNDALVHKVGDVASLREHIDLLACRDGYFQKLWKNSISGASNLTLQKAAERLFNIYKKSLTRNAEMAVK